MISEYKQQIESLWYLLDISAEDQDAFKSSVPNSLSNEAINYVYDFGCIYCSILIIYNNYRMLFNPDFSHSFHRFVKRSMVCLIRSISLLVLRDFIGNYSTVLQTIDFSILDVPESLRFVWY